MHGIRCFNDAGHVLISSEVPGLHYAGDASYAGVVSIMPESSVAGENGGRIETDGHSVHRFVFSTTGVPLVFLKTSLGIFYAVMTHKRSGNDWTFDIIQSGSSPIVPRVLIFTTADALPNPAGTGYGIAAYQPDGTKTFDSRLSPLGIYGGGLAAPPAYPPNGGPTPDAERYVEMGEGQDPWPQLDWDFHSTASFSETVVPVNINPGDLMFCAPSLAQSCWIRSIHHHWYDDTYGPDQHHDVFRKWWVFYRNSFRIRSSSGGTFFDAGWSPYACGYSEIRDYEGGWFGGGSYFNSGAPPFSQKTINLTPNAFLIGDASNYA